MTINILFYILSFFIAIILCWILIIEIRLKRIFSGFKAKNMESLIAELTKKTKELEEERKKTELQITSIDKRLAQSIRNIETVRFNPFPQVGGNQSFAMSLLNDEGNGVVISSLYSRDRTSLFAKPIKAGQSEFELTKEEKNVLKKSIK
ncbi:MAG TPA: DUF4446 family protein [Candidatus Paceibacterota bacterium]|jgi:hypothetical protein|nr:DUF4446 family protein [Candidatus Paceibacterota bacterium]HOX90869.1 DUF4446 family protein [Candidatus Paceibacterota bacterium]HPC12682.1 DUF4446 family protein [Candidatus Paceibacterota bacterium]HPI66780.1 DUF4446 family protein [Candidatus Paceibacterota bacterium]HQC46321.1 DUF4446 family protein [Candidatus Paceibacterota bacterium]